MRLITFTTLFVFGLTCTSTKNATIQSNKLSGTWVPIQQEMGGTSLPKAAFESQKLIINDSTYTVIAESIDKGVVKYRDNKIDIYGKEGVNAGKHFTAIYKYENLPAGQAGGLLTICYNLSGNGYPEAFETKGKPMYLLSIFKKS
jgi:uncharacterized protein (TIGR03067 family)